MRNANTSTRAPILAFALLTLAACGSTPGGPSGTACTSDAQCGGDSYCDLSGATGRATEPLLDPECFVACVSTEMCAPGDSHCENQCAESCGGTCAELCDQVCFDGVGIDPACVAECVPACEADRSMPPPSGGDAGTSTPPPAAEGVCRPRAPAPTDGGTTPPRTDSGTPPVPIDWTGTWSVRARYTATCMWSSAGAPNTANLDLTVTARLTGSNGDLTADFLSGSYTMTGTGNDSRLTLSGQFPGRDHNDNAATTVMRDNQVTLTIDDVVDRSTARGTLSGSYETSGGISCRIESGGSVELTR